MLGGMASLVAAVSSPPPPLLCACACLCHQVEAHAGLISRAEQEAARLAEERQAVSARTAQLTAQVRQSIDGQQQHPAFTS